MIQGTHNALDDPRNETVKIFINGELIARKDAKISVFDSGYLVGDGVWEALRCIMMYLYSLIYILNDCGKLHIYLPFLLAKKINKSHIGTIQIIKCMMMFTFVYDYSWD